jgi:hypothetical protein
LCGAVVKVDAATGRAVSIERVNELFVAPAPVGADGSAATRVQEPVLPA